MQDNNQLKIIDPNTLVPTALEMKNSGYRLVQICATRTEDGYELTYSFAKGYRLKNLRFEIAEETEIMSVSNIFEPAFLYENEIHDLFGIKINLIKIDYNGTLYKTAKETPFK